MPLLTNSHGDCQVENAMRDEVVAMIDGHEYMHDEDALQYL